MHWVCIQYIAKKFPGGYFHKLRMLRCVSIFWVTFPHEGLGVKSRMCPPYPQRDRKRRLNGAVCRNHRIKRVVPCRSMCRHIYMTEISLIVTLNNQFNSAQLSNVRKLHKNIEKARKPKGNQLFDTLKPYLTKLFKKSRSSGIHVDVWVLI